MLENYVVKIRLCSSLSRIRFATQQEACFSNFVSVLNDLDVCSVPCGADGHHAAGAADLGGPERPAALPRQAVPVQDDNVRVHSQHQGGRGARPKTMHQSPGNISTIYLVVQSRMLPLHLQQKQFTALKRCVKSPEETPGMLIVYSRMQTHRLYMKQRCV